MPPAVSKGTAGEGPHVGVAFLVALGLHLGAVAAIAFWPPHSTVTSPGEQEITIDLAPAMEMAEPVHTVEATAPATDLPVEESHPIEETAQAQPEEIREASIPPQEEMREAMPHDEVEAVVAVPLPDETVMAKTMDEKPREEPKKPLPPRVERKPTPRREVAERRPAPLRPQASQAPSSRENTGGMAASADPTAFNRYAAQLRAALQSRLRYPAAEDAARISGVATVRFTVLRSGRIVSASLVRSAGNAALDQAALAAASPGSMLPAAPDAISQEQFTFSIPLKFDQ